MKDVIAASILALLVGCIIGYCVGVAITDDMSWGLRSVEGLLNGLRASLGG